MFGKADGHFDRSQTPLVLNLADLFWKKLVGVELTAEDVMAIDQEFSNRVATIVDMGKEDEAMWGEVCKQMGLTYTVKTVDGRTVELFPGGQEVFVPWSDRLHYVDMMKDYRLKEMNPQIEAVYRGLSTQVPRHFLSLFTASELREIVTGRAEINVKLLQENTEYGDGFSGELEGGAVLLEGVDGLLQ